MGGGKTPLSLLIYRMKLMMVKFLSKIWKTSVTIAILALLVLVAVVGKLVFDDKEWEVEED